MAAKLCVVIASFLLVVTASSQVYDPNTDFSTSQNPSGVWTYGARSNGVFLTAGTNHNGAWGLKVSGGSAKPMVGSGIFLSSDVPMQAGLRFTAPSSARYRIEVSLRMFQSPVMGPPGGHIAINNEIVFSPDSHVDYNQVHQLNSGDTIDFLTRSNSMPTSLSVSGTITRIEPLSEVLFRPAAGLFTNQVTVEILNDLGTGVIRFTTNGLSPASSSAIAPQSLTFTNHVNLQAAVFSNDVRISQVYTAIYSRVYALDDGIPNSWREQFFGPGYLTDSRVVPNADPDGDGSTNREEYLAGTNPLDVTSGFRAGIEAVPKLRFSTQPNRTYEVKRRNNQSETFQTIATIVATNSVTTFVDENPGTNAFYLIGLLP